MATSVSDLSGLFKTVYAPDILSLLPEASKLVRLISFKQEERIGEQFQQPVIVSYEHGVTYAAPSAGAFTLNDPISMKTQKALVDGYQHLLRASMDYETAAKASSGGPKAFRKATELQVENMMESITKRLELDLIYGQTTLGTIESSSNVDTTHTILQISDATWASGIWSGMENATLNIYDSVAAIVGTSAADKIFTITFVDVVNKRLTVSGVATSGIGALDTAVGVGNCNIYFKGAVSASMAGIVKIIQNTGTLFNISAASYGLWKSNTASNGSAALTLGKIISHLAVPIGRGLDEDVTVLVNDKTWANMATDQAALRKYDAKYDESKAKNGFKTIQFVSANGLIDIMPYNCIMEGIAICIPVKQWKRIGATDITWTLPGGDPENPKFFRELADSAGFEYRVYSDQAVFTPKPAKSLLITGIVNS